MKIDNNGMAILELNDPVEYQELETLSCILITGHFAGYDKDGYPYVFSEGGTSYTRNPFQIVKCKKAFPLTNRRDEAVKTDQYIEIMCYEKTNINTVSNEQGAFIVSHEVDLQPSTTVKGFK
jgi:hypothetical protein